MKKILCLVLFMVWMSPGLAASPTVLVMGDSLSAAYGMQQSQGWVALLEDRLQAEGYPHRVVNASISGETTGGGLRRLPTALDKHDPEIVIIELGANDGLRALSIDTMLSNLKAMIEKSQTAGARVLLLGMRIPSNYGPTYTGNFYQAFAEVAEATEVARVEFFLAPIALKTKYFQADRIHPNASAQPLLLDHVWPALEPLLENE